MTFQLTWLAEVLERAGLKVAEVPGWRSRGRAEMGTVRGVMCHHTANPQIGNMPTLGQLVNGRAASAKTSALAGPLAQLGLGRDGTFYIVAAGRANHAGQGNWEGVINGNSNFIGIEAENDGVREKWPDVQMEAYQRGVAAILKKIEAGANMCCGHKEYATPKGRKIDPDFDMSAFRKAVSSYIAGAMPLPQIPASDPQQRPTLRRGSVAPEVKIAQGLLGVSATGIFDAATEAKLRDEQRKADLVPDGILGPKSWALIAAPGFAPTETANSSPTAPLALIAAAPGGLAAGGAPSPVDLPRVDDFHQEGTIAVGPGGHRFATTKRNGFFTIGDTSLAVWLGGLAGSQVPASVQRVLVAMCVNEGGLEAINSYDGSHMSFGIFQWTAGADDDPGELAVLLDLVKGSEPSAFAECFGRFGLDCVVSGPNDITGVLTLKGATLKTAQSKDQLRSIAWAYRFWRAGHHPAVRRAQLALAAKRLDRFRLAPLSDRRLQDWMSSELAIALVLDEHVNRPGHVPATLASALHDVSGSVPSDPTHWTDADEQKLVHAYLERRADTNMTDSDKRAAKIADFVRRRLLSDARGSFQRG